MKLQPLTQQVKPNIIVNYTNYVNMFQLNFNENPFNKANLTPTLSNLIKHNSMINLTEKVQQLDSTSGASSCEPQYKPYSEQHSVKKLSISQQSSCDIFKLYALLLVISVGMSFVTFCYFPLASWLLPQAKGNILLKFFKEDDYYCFLFPLMFPLTVLILYCNWVCMKFFRHS